jgi:hypothetical protein
MNASDRAFLHGWVIAPLSPRRITPQEILDHFGTKDPAGLVRRLLDDAAATKTAADLEAALLASAALGMPEDRIAFVAEIARAEWHEAHEWLAEILGDSGLPDVVPTLVHLCDWVPGYLSWDDTRSLARKAVSALGRIPGGDAEAALVRLAERADPVVREQARRQLAAWSRRDDP